MAGNVTTAAEAFKSLERTEDGNKKNSLDAKEEKALLKQVERTDIINYKNDLDKKCFKFGDTYLTLKQMVMGFQEQTNTIKYRGRDHQFHEKAVEPNSDYAAAMQYYLIAYGKDIRTNKQKSSDPKGKVTDGIDGYIGTTTKQKITELRKEFAPSKGNGTKIDRNQGNDIIDEVKEQSVERLANAIYTEYVGKYNSITYDLLSTEKGINNGALKSKIVNGTKVTIKYKSAVDNKYYSIVVDASTCKTGKQYSVDKFGKAIENAIKAQEDTLQTAKDEKEAQEKHDAKLKAMIKDVEDFDTTKLSNKSQEYLKENGYVRNNSFDFKKGKGTGIAIIDTGLTLGSVLISHDDINKIWESGKFNENKFVSIAGGAFDKKADTYYIAKGHKIAEDTKGIIINTSSAETVEAQINKAVKDIEDIEALGVTIDDADKEIVTNKKSGLDKVNAYNEVSSVMDEKLSNIEKKIDDSRLSMVEQKKIRDELKTMDTNLANRIAFVNGKNIYVVYKGMRNGEQLYNDLHDRVKGIRSKIE